MWTGLSSQSLPDTNEGPFYHSAERALTLQTLTPYLHVGSPEQATMRRHNGILHRIDLKPVMRIGTLKDTGHWSIDRLKRASRKYPLIRYLNRFEGVAIEDLVNATLYADESDKIFKRNIPSANYSWIILDPSIISTITIDE